MKSGAGRENISVLATCCADGHALDPLIIFSGINFQSTWHGKNSLPNTLYGISKNGWMTTEIFALWFKNFVKQIKKCPLLVVYNGHLTHVSLNLIEKAMEEHITIVKLPPHITGKLQPLDACCFGPLKQEWEEKLSERMNLLGPREKIPKSVFVDLLSEIWHKCLSSSNIKSGFRATGIYPINREKYPQDRFDQRLLKRYKNWVDLGRPEDIKEELSTAMNMPQKGKLPSSLNETAASDIEATEKVTNEIHNGNIEFMVQQINHELEAPSDSSIFQKHTMKPSCSSTPELQSELRYYCAELGRMPPNIPGKIWVPAWTLRENKSFSELVLDKMKGPTNKPPTKRRKVDRKTAIITDPGTQKNKGKRRK